MERLLSRPCSVDDDVGGYYGEEMVPQETELNALDLRHRGITGFKPGAFDCYTFANESVRPTVFDGTRTQVSDPPTRLNAAHRLTSTCVALCL